MKEWYYIADDDRLGPFSLDELKGKIDEETKVWKKGMTKWEKAARITELSSLMNFIPELPVEELNLGRDHWAYRYIRTGMMSGRIFITMLLVLTVLEGRNLNGTGRYGFILFLSLAALVFLLHNLRKYLRLLPEVKGSDVNIYWIKITSVPIFMLFAYAKGHNPSSSFYSYGILIIVLAFILNGYHSLRLAQKLSYSERPGIVPFRRYAYLQFFYSILVFVVVIVALFLMIFTDSDNLSSPLTLREGLAVQIIEMLPYLFLQYGLLKVKRNYFVQQPAF